MVTGSIVSGNNPVIVNNSPMRKEMIIHRDSSRPVSFITESEVYMTGINL